MRVPGLCAREFEKCQSCEKWHWQMPFGTTWRHPSQLWHFLTSRSLSVTSNFFHPLAKVRSVNYHVFIFSRVFCSFPRKCPKCHNHQKSLFLSSSHKKNLTIFNHFRCNTFVALLLPRQWGRTPVLVHRVQDDSRECSHVILQKSQALHTDRVILIISWSLHSYKHWVLLGFLWSPHSSGFRLRHKVVFQEMLSLCQPFILSGHNSLEVSSVSGKQWLRNKEQG